MFFIPKILLKCFLIAVLLCQSIISPNNSFLSEVIQDNLESEVKRSKLWKDVAPVPMEDMRYLTLLYYGFDGKKHTGHLLVHEKVAEEVLNIFKEIFDAKFSVESMELIDLDRAYDNTLMWTRNTSALCVREKVGGSGFSNHSYGLAIDVNPFQNPFYKLKDGIELIVPSGGKAYLDREDCVKKQVKGLITDSGDNPCYQAFTKRGWEWGGHWSSCKDYMHFQKDPKSLETIEN